MKNFLVYLSSVPILASFSLGFLSALVIELNRFFPDGLIF